MLKGPLPDSTILPFSQENISFCSSLPFSPMSPDLGFSLSAAKGGAAGDVCTFGNGLLLLSPGKGLVFSLTWVLLP